MIAAPGHNAGWRSAMAHHSVVSVTPTSTGWIEPYVAQVTLLAGSLRSRLGASESRWASIEGKDDVTG